MLNSEMIVFITAELAFVLLVVSLFLLFHVWKQKKLVGLLEEKIVSLRKALKLSKKETQAALQSLKEKEKVKPKDLIQYLDEEIDNTREYHQTLNPDRDIVLDIATDAPLDRQASSLRHAFLIAEKEARYAGEEVESSWEVLQGKLQQIIQFYASSVPPAEPTEPVGTDVDGHSASAEEQRTDETERADDTIAANQEEMDRLRKVAADQHEEISSLKLQLENADSSEERETVLAGMTTQLAQQERFLQEAETCTKLVEDELVRVSKENDSLRSKLEKPDSPANDENTEEMQQLESTVVELTDEGKQMLSTIAAFEEENRGLKEQVGSSNSGDESTELLQSKLAGMQQELLNLQTQYIELEERYTELQGSA